MFCYWLTRSSSEKWPVKWINRMHRAHVCQVWRSHKIFTAKQRPAKTQCCTDGLATHTNTVLRNISQASTVTICGHSRWSLPILMVADDRTTSTPTGWHGPKQSTWPRTDHSGGCWQLVALRTRSGASRRWWWWSLKVSVLQPQSYLEILTEMKLLHCFFVSTSDSLRQFIWPFDLKWHWTYVKFTEDIK